MTKLWLIRVYYEDAQRVHLDPDAVSQCAADPNLRKPGDPGATAGRRSSAGGLLEAELLADGREDRIDRGRTAPLSTHQPGRFDAYTYDGIARGSELADNRDNPIGALIGRLQRLHGLIEDHVWVPVFCNYWFASSQVCGRYLRLLEQLHQSVQQDRLCQALLQQGVLQHRNRERSLHAFIYEYFFGLFLRNSPVLRVGQVYRMAGADGSQQPRVM